jgi:hypothetical protein
MAERKLDEARSFLAPEMVMTFPPAAVYRSLDELVAGARGRYCWCDKVRTDWDAYTRDDGAIVVYSRGTLFGENTFGVRFDGVRYVDRFELVDGLITRQDVWNDLAESGVLLERPAAGVAESR